MNVESIRIIIVKLVSSRDIREAYLSNKSIIQFVSVDVGRIQIHRTTLNLLVDWRIICLLLSLLLVSPITKQIHR